MLAIPTPAHWHRLHQIQRSDTFFKQIISQSKYEIGQKIQNENDKINKFIIEKKAGGRKNRRHAFSVATALALNFTSMIE